MNVGSFRACLSAALLALSAPALAGVAPTDELAAPVPVKFMSWFSPNDMPAYVNMRGGTWRVLTRTTVEPDGKIQSCDAERSSGDPKLDDLTCKIILQRGKYLPAHWSDGSAVYGVSRTFITWHIGSSREKVPADFVVKEKQLPHGRRSPVLVELALAVDEQGHPHSCAQEPQNGGSRVTTDPNLLAIACSTLTESFAGIPVVDKAGMPVRSVQNATVRFDKKI